MLLAGGSSLSQSSGIGSVGAINSIVDEGIGGIPSSGNISLYSLDITCGISRFHGL